MGGMITLSDRVELRARVVQQVEAGELGDEEGCELLDVKQRTLRWLRRRCRQQGVRGLVHGNAGRRPANAYPDELHKEILDFAKQPKCEEMNQVYLTEILAMDKKIFVSRATVRRDLQRAGISSPRRKRRRKLFRRRTPRPRAGMLLQMDATTHLWIRGLPEFTLHTAVDDASRELDAVRRPTEDGWGYFAVFRKVAEKHGLPDAIYVDRHSIFGGSTPMHKKRQQEFSQFERAMHELGVRVIKAKTAQAKGRVERNNDTLQDRLVSWFKYEEIASMEQVDPSMAKYMTQHQRRFTIAPQLPEPAWRPVPSGVDLDDVLCLKHARVVRRDNTISFASHKYDVPPGVRNSGLAKQVVHVLESLDGRLRVAHQGKVIADLRGPRSQPLARPATSAHSSLQPLASRPKPRQLPRKPQTNLVFAQ